MRRKKAPRVVWLPIDGTNAVNGTNATMLEALFSMDTRVAGNNSSLEIPIVQDFKGQRQGGVATNSLSDMENSSYRLRRIVGKVFVQLAVNSTGIGTPLVAVTAGFIIRRMDEATGISLASSAGTEVADSRDNTGDPWIWRRTWLLGDPQAALTQGVVIPASATVPGGAYDYNGPNSDNFSWGPSALDGPHIDQKTARIVGLEERLFLDVATRIIVPGTDAAQPIALLTDLRVLASMRPGIGNRRNASR